MFDQDRFLKWALMASVAVLLFTLGQRALWDPDEGRYAEMAREILVLHEWITPHLNYIPYFEKPMLFMWLVAIAFKIFGPSGWVAQIIPMLSALVGAALIGVMARKTWGTRAGLVASLCLMTSLEYLILASVVDINMTLTAFITAAMVFFWIGHSEHRTGFFLASWVSMALATMTKGPIGIILPMGAICLYILFTRQFRLIKEFRPVLGMLIFIAITVPWFSLMGLRHPEFLSYFFVDQNFQRYTVSSEHNRPFYYFLLVIMGGALPWTFLLPSAIKKVWNDRMSNEILYISLWFAVIVLFFMPSQSKLATYMLPCFPPVALLMGYVFKGVPMKGGIFLHVTGSLWLCIGFSLLFFPALSSHGMLPVLSPRAVPLMEIGPAVGAIILAGTVMAIWIGRTYDAAAGFAILGISMMVIMMAFTHLWDDQRSTKSLVQDLPADARLCAYKRYYQSSSFYAKRPVILVDAAGELKFGIRHYPDKARTLTLDELARLMNTDTNTYCLTSGKNLAVLREKLPRITIVRQLQGLALVNVPAG